MGVPINLFLYLCPNYTKSISLKSHSATFVIFLNALIYLNKKEIPLTIVVDAVDHVRLVPVAQ